MANKHEKFPSFTGTRLLMNLVRNNSVALLFIIPKSRKSKNSAVIDRWNYPVKKFELRNDNFLRLTLSKEIHSRQSSKGSPCSELDEEFYYEVELSSSYRSKMENPYNGPSATMVKRKIDPDQWSNPKAGLPARHTYYQVIIH